MPTNINNLITAPRTNSINPPIDTEINNKNIYPLSANPSNPDHLDNIFHIKHYQPLNNISTKDVLFNHKYFQELIDKYLLPHVSYIYDAQYIQHQKITGISFNHEYLTNRQITNTMVRINELNKNTPIGTLFTLRKVCSNNLRKYKQYFPQFMANIDKQENPLTDNQLEYLVKCIAQYLCSLYEKAYIQSIIQGLDTIDSIKQNLSPKENKLIDFDFACIHEGNYHNLCSKLINELGKYAFSTYTISNEAKRIFFCCIKVHTSANLTQKQDNTAQDSISQNKNTASLANQQLLNQIANPPINNDITLDINEFSSDGETTDVDDINIQSQFFIVES